MAMNHLEKLEETLLRFRLRYDEVCRDRDGLAAEVSELRDRVDGLLEERRALHDRVDAMIDELENLGI